MGGFVLADPFDTFLRRLSTDYIREAYERLSSALDEHRLRPNDLSWGSINTFGQMSPDNPIAGMGWVSDKTMHLDSPWTPDTQYVRLGDDLSSRSPALRFWDSYRSLKWNVSPEDFEMALRLLELCCLDEISN